MTTPPIFAVRLFEILSGTVTAPAAQQSESSDALWARFEGE